MTQRIVSLLPSATEVLWFLGLGDRVVGVTYECLVPPEAATRPKVTDTIVPEGAEPAEIDRIIAAAVADDRPLYRLDRDLLNRLDPDLIVTQDLCRVCALPAGDVDAALAELGCRAEVFSYDPMTLPSVFDAMRELAAQAGAGGDATSRVDAVAARLERIRKAASGPAPRVLLLEWTDPAYVAGHWIPDQIVAAGGNPVLAHPGGRSSAVAWEQVAASAADIVFVAPCGFDRAEAARQTESVLARPELAELPAVMTGWVRPLDGDAHVVRPGPRLVDGVEVMAGTIAAWRQFQARPVPPVS
ncbi:MAG: ABC transporter substrate-binding protein [Acidimicrobiales bacterium]